MIIQIPSEFLDTYGKPDVSERIVHINTNMIVYVDTSKVQWDDGDIQYRSDMVVQGNYIPLKIMNEYQYQKFIVWFNKAMAIGDFE